MCGPSVIGSKCLIYSVGRSLWQIVSDGCTPSSFVGEPRVTAAFLTTSNRYAWTTKGLLVGVLRSILHHRLGAQLTSQGDTIPEGKKMPSFLG
jgi:hypothetical protein